MLTMKPSLSERFEKFVDRVNGPTLTGYEHLGACHIWCGSRDREGYGSTRVNGKHVRAPRLAWSLVNGEMPACAIATHLCDNPSCVREDHITPGTFASNARERSARKRDARSREAARALMSSPESRARIVGGVWREKASAGSRAFGLDPVRSARRRAAAHLANRGTGSSSCKLTEDQVHEIRVAQGMLSEIASKYGVSPVTVCQIRSGKVWSWLPRTSPIRGPA